MAFMVVSQHFYTDNLLQFVTLYSSATDFNVAYTDLENYVGEVNKLEGYHAYMSRIETMTVNKIRNFVDTEPRVNAEIDMYKSGYVITASFARTKIES